MAFTLEDGTLVADANAYISVAFFQAWHTDRGVDVADFEATQIQAAIIKATDYVDKRFGTKFVGTKRDKDQSLQWPRSNAWDNQNDYIDSDTVPVPLKRAVAEYAFLAIKLNELLPTPAPSFNKVNLTTGETEVSQGGLLQRKKEKVGPIEEETWYNQEQWRLVLSGRAAGAYSDLSSLVNLPEYPVADEWLKPIVKAGNNATLSRG